jgi:hypothetical protein
MKTKLETEAKKYVQSKRTPKDTKPLTARRYLAGQALAGLLVNSRGSQMIDIKKAAYEWADYMLDDDTS